jgi:hypothetical protein
MNQVLVVFGGFFFFEVLTPSTLGGCKFLIFHPFSTIVSVLDAPRGGVQYFLGHQKY